MKLRYSVRALLALTCLVAIVCCWGVCPGIVANRFTNALVAKDYAKATKMLDKDLALNLVDWATNGKDLEAEATFEKPTLSDWLRGQRRGLFTAKATFDQTVIGRRTVVVATPTRVAFTRTEESKEEVASNAEKNWEYVLEALDAGLEVASDWLNQLRR